MPQNLQAGLPEGRGEQRRPRRALQSEGRAARVLLSQRSQQQVSEDHAQSCNRNGTFIHRGAKQSLPVQTFLYRIRRLLKIWIKQNLTHASSWSSLILQIAASWAILVGKSVLEASPEKRKEVVGMQEEQTRGLLEKCPC